MAEAVRQVDSKGRVTIGERFANRTVIIETTADEVVVRLARVIPEREARLYQNPEANGAASDELSRIAAGAAQAHAQGLPRDEFRDWPGF